MGESSSSTKWFRLYYKTPAIRMFIQPDFVLGWLSSLGPSVLLHDTQCTQAGGAAAQTGHPRATVPLTLGCGGRVTKPQSALGSAEFRTDLSLCPHGLRALQASCQARATRHCVSMRGMGQIHVTACNVMLENTIAAGSRTALWSGCSHVSRGFLVTSLIQMNKQTSSSH